MSIFFTIILAFLFGGDSGKVYNNCITEEDVAFIQWETCIYLSDGSDASCHECDLLFNPKGYDFETDLLKD